MSTDSAEAQVRVEFALGAKNFAMRAAVDVPSGAITTTALLPVLQELSTAIVSATVAQETDETHAVSCKAGCGACCRQLVPITLFEAEFLTQWVRSLPPEQQSALAARFDHAVQALAASGILPRLNPQVLPGENTQERERLALDYLELRIPCPFLQDESCGIYPIRPLICREYLVTSPPVFCSNPTRDTVQPVVMPIQVSRSLLRLGSELTGGGPGWLPLTMLFAWIRSGTTLAGAPAAPGPEMLQTVLAHLSAPSA